MVYTPPLDVVAISFPLRGELIRPNEMIPEQPHEIQACNEASCLGFWSPTSIFPKMATPSSVHDKPVAIGIIA